jgi:hypothetical protein
MVPMDAAADPLPAGEPLPARVPLPAGEPLPARVPLPAGEPLPARGPLPKGVDDDDFCEVETLLGVGDEVLHPASSSTSPMASTDLRIMI